MPDGPTTAETGLRPVTINPVPEGAPRASGVATEPGELINAATPTDTAPATPPPAEAVNNPEVPLSKRGRLAEEVKRAQSAMVDTITGQARNERASQPEGEQKKWEENNPGKNALVTVDILHDLPSLPPSERYNNGAGIPIAGTGARIMYTKGGQEAEIEVVLSGTDAMFTCLVKLNGGSPYRWDIPRPDVIKAQVKAEQKTIDDVLTDRQKKYLGQYFQSFEWIDPTAPLGQQEADALDQELMKIGPDLCIITGDDYEAAVTMQTIELPVPANATQQQLEQIATENRRRLIRREQLLKRREGKNFMDYEDISALFLTDLPQNLEAATTQIKRLEDALKTKNLDAATRAHYETLLVRAEVQQKLLQALKTATQTPEGERSFKQLFDNLQSGQLEAAQNFITAFREGRMDDAIDTLFPDLKETTEMTEEQRLKVRHRRELYKKYGKGGGLGFLLLLAAAGMAVKGALGEER